MYVAKLFPLISLFQFYHVLVRDSIKKGNELDYLITEKLTVI